MTKFPTQTKKTDYILDSNVDKEEQLQRTLHTEVRTEFLYLTRTFVSHIEKMIVSERMGLRFYAPIRRSTR